MKALHNPNRYGIMGSIEKSVPIPPYRGGGNERTADMTKFITVSENETKTGIYDFYKEVNVSEKGQFKINLFASERYILYINDKYICEGPCRGKQEVRYFDTVEAVLDKGINTIRMEVMHLTVKEQFSTVYKTKKPVVIFEAVSENERITSDDTWKCSYRSGHRLFKAEGYFDSLAPSEEIYAAEPCVEIKTDFWDGIEIDFSKEPEIPWGCLTEIGFLKPRPIPMIYPGKKVNFKTVKKGDGFIELDAGEYVCARVYADIAPMSNVKMIYSECYVSPENGKKCKRDDSTGELRGVCDLIHTGKDGYHFETYWFKAFRFIRIEADNAQNAVDNIYAERINYPLNITSTFECSDEYFNKMYKTSINTMLCCMHEIFVDCPHYEQQQYEMDTAVEANVSMKMSNDTELVKKCIEDLAGSQCSSGMLRANYPCAWVQIIPGFSFFWIFLLRNYLDYTRDSGFVYENLGVMDKILSYFDNEVRKNGYISRSNVWDYVDWVVEWNKGVPDVKQGDILTVYNLYYLYALKNAAYICEKLGKAHYADEYNERYEKLKKTVNDLCFDGELYTDGHESKNHSMHTIIWAVLSGAAEGERAEKIMKHIKDGDISKTSFSMNYYLFRAIEKSGFYNELMPDMFDGWKHMLDLNCTTWCETYPEITRSECHAWSSAPLYEFMSCVLGVQCTYDDGIVIKPNSLRLTYAKGAVPTVYGNVDVSWEITDGNFRIKIKAPNDVKKLLIMPDGTKHEFTEAEFSAENGTI